MWHRVRSAVVVAGFLALSFSSSPWCLAADDPENTHKSLAAGIALLREGDFDRAVETLSSVTRSLARSEEAGNAYSRDLASAYLHLGLAHLGLDQSDLAQAAFRHALRAAPTLEVTTRDFPPASVAAFDAVRAQQANEYTREAEHLLLRGMRQEARDVARTAVQLDPESQHALTVRNNAAAPNREWDCRRVKLGNPAGRCVVNKEGFHFKKLTVPWHRVLAVCEGRAVLGLRKTLELRLTDGTNVTFWDLDVGQVLRELDSSRQAGSTNLAPVYVGHDCPKKGWSRPWLGIAIRDCKGGVRVGEVVPESPGQAAGLAAGDVIVAMDDTRITGLHDFFQSLFGRSPGMSVEIRLLRDGVAKTVTADLGTYPRSPRR